MTEAKKPKETLRDMVLRFAVQNTMSGKHTTIGVTAWLASMLDEVRRVTAAFEDLVGDGLLEIKHNGIFGLYYATDKAIQENQHLALPPPHKPADIIGLKTND
jgi:hypothetical protein